MGGELELGAFLKARRGYAQPEDIGLRRLGPRRVPGLRREEVAMLSGVSVDYYSRLEQGRERSPSPTVLNAIATALGCDRDERDHLFRLAHLSPSSPVAPSARLQPGLQDLLDSWPHTPAFILNRRLDFVLTNALAAALYDPFSHRDNLARMTFLDPVAHDFFNDWAEAARGCVASLRYALGHRESSRGTHALIDELRAGSDEFARLWTRNDARGKTRAAKTVQHPAVGSLSFTMAAFDVREAPEHQLIVYQATNASIRDKVTLLGALAAHAES